MNLFLFKIRKQLLVVVMIFITFSSYAQTQAEIEMAKTLARQQGYSEQQINAILNKQSSTVTNSKVSTAPKRVVASPLEMPDEMVKAKTVEINKAKTVAKNTNIYGHELFLSGAAFIPNYNLPTPENYILSAGDEIVIDLWGDVFYNIVAEISPEGSVIIDKLGPVSLHGLTIKEAEKRLKQQLSKIYSGLLPSNLTTNMQISLGRIRSITVNIVGDVNSSGSYTLPSLSTLFSALYMANGVSSIGTIRDIQLIRNDKIIERFDLYNFLLSGLVKNSRSSKPSIRLEDNDLIRVSTYKTVVSISGAVKRPMRYEMKDGESLSTLLDFAGGFTVSANQNNILLTRNSETPVKRYDLSISDASNFELKNGDQITIRSKSERQLNNVSVTGAVWYPGGYSISDTLSTVRELITKAGGLVDEAFLDRAILNRVDSTGKTEMISFSLSKMIIGEEKDIELIKNDNLRIFTIMELEQKTTIRIAGEVNNPSQFDYKEGMTLADAILLAGSITDAATLSRVEIARRIANTNAIKSSDTIADIIVLNLAKNLMDAEIKLKPYDIIYIRRAPNYKPQVTIGIDGEVNFPGQHVIEKNEVRLSDIVKKANGFTNEAYIDAAKLSRALTEEEYNRLVLAMDIARQRLSTSRGNDEISLDAMSIGERYTVAIDLQKAVDNPGSFADLVLRTGDVIIVPQMSNTVKISGGVFYPNVVTYNPDLSVKDYINMAGGYSELARKRKAYIVHMSGEISTKKSKGGFNVRPGSEIIIPTKNLDNRTKMSAAEIMSMTTSSASLAAMVITIVNSFK